LLDPQQLIAGDRAVLASAPDENELIARQLNRLDAALDAKHAERARLLDAYQAGLLDLQELTRRTSALTARHNQLARERETLTTRSAELATQNRLRCQLTGFSERIAASIDDLDFEGRRRLLRLVVENVSVSGWRVELQLKIPLSHEPPADADPPDHGPPGPDKPKPGPIRPGPPSSDVRLRSVHRDVPGGDFADRDPATARACRSRDHIPIPPRNRQHRDHPDRPPTPGAHDPRQSTTHASALSPPAV